MNPAYMPAWAHYVPSFHGRPWGYTGREYAFLVRASRATDWMRVTQRGLMGSTGYSLKGVHTALVAFRRAGHIAIRTKLGRKGGTWIRPQRGLLQQLHGLNVSAVVERPKRTLVNRSTLGNISVPKPSEHPLDAVLARPSPSWTELRAILSK